MFSASGANCLGRNQESEHSLTDGPAGDSARHEYEKRRNARETRIDTKWGGLAGVVKFFSDDPHSTKAWAKGSDGERRLAAHLAESLEDRAVLLHDRKVPGTKGNIDHLVIASSGVWVVDAKNYKGKVERRDVGGLFKSDQRLYIAGRDRTKIAAGLSWQVDAVRQALSEIEAPIRPVICFIAADWDLFAKPFEQNGVLITWPQKLVEQIATPGPVTAEAITQIAECLANTLPHWSL